MRLTAALALWATVAVIDSIIMAADMIARHTTNKKFNKRIIIATDAGSTVDTDLLDSVIQSLNDQAIRVQLL